MSLISLHTQQHHCYRVPQNSLQVSNQHVPGPLLTNWKLRTGRSVNRRVCRIRVEFKGHLTKHGPKHHANAMQSPQIQSQACHSSALTDVRLHVRAKSPPAYTSRLGAPYRPTHVCGSLCVVSYTRVLSCYEQMRWHWHREKASNTWLLICHSPLQTPYQSGLAGSSSV